MIAAGGVFHRWRLLLLLAAFRSSISCLPALAATTQPLATPAGPLVIEQVNVQEPHREFKVYLASQMVSHSKEGDAATAFPDFPEPVVIGYVGERIGGFDAVAVFQQFSSGNACNGGPIWLLGISRDGGFTRSKPIDACGGPAPQVTVNHSVIHLTLRQTGKTSPAEEWTYSGQELQRTR
jgi:hypothetical protein